LRTIINSLDWPRSYSPTNSNADYPSDREPGWSDELQGVTHDRTTWFFTQEHTVWMFPLSHDLSDEVIATDRSYSSTSLGINGDTHLGDCDYYQGRLYIPIERGLPRVLAATVGSSSLHVGPRDIAPLAAQAAPPSEAPWCAVNPLNGLLYSSYFDIAADQGLLVYKPLHSAIGFTLDFVGNFTLHDENGATMSVNRVQGGAFSPRGHLYLVSDEPSGGILAFDMLTGRIVHRIPVDYQPFADILLYGTVRKEELEGITIWDLDPGYVPGISGQLHLIMIDNYGSGDDDLYFKHFAVNAEDRDKV
jgi:hypothetical protein